MPSTYTLNNGIELIGTGEQSGTWGDTTNLNLELLDTALDGQVTVTLSSTGTSGSPNVLPISDGTSSNGRNRMVIFNDGSDIGGTVYVQLTPNDAEKIVYVRNSLSGSRSILLFQGTYNASNDYEIPAGTTAIVFFNGAGTGAVASNVFNNAYFDSLRLGGVSVTAILDEDDMSSDSATALATQQSIKKYVDDKAAAQDTLAEVLANGNTTGGTDIVVSVDDVISMDNGTNLLPSLTTTGDLNTGLYFPAADEVGLTVGGTQRLNVSATGVDVTGNLTVDTDTLYVNSTNNRVGIGTTALTHNLEIREDINGIVGARITNPNSGSSAYSLLYFGTDENEVHSGIFQTSSTNTNYGGANSLNIWTNSGSYPIAFHTNNTEAMRIDSSQRVLIGTTSSQDIGSKEANLQVRGLSGQDAAISIVRNDSGVVGGSFFVLGKSRGSSEGDATIVNDGDTLGTIRWAGADGTDVASPAAEILAAVDSTPGSNDMPGRLIFKTTSDGNQTPTERMRITSGGRVGINTAGESGTPLGWLTIDNNINSANVLTNKASYHVVLGVDGGHTDNYIGGIGFGDTVTSTIQAAISAVDNGTSAATGIAFATGNTSAVNEAMRIDSSQRVLIGTTSTRGTYGLTVAEPSDGIRVFGIASGGMDALHFDQARGSVASPTASNADGDGSYLSFSSYDGTNFDDIGSLAVVTDGVQDAGRMIFRTTPTGGSQSERMRITSGGLVGINAVPTDYNDYGDGLVVRKSSITGSSGITVQATANTGYSSLYFGDPDDTKVGGLEYSHSLDSLFVVSGNSTAMVLDSSQRVLINTSSVAVGSTTEAHLQVATASGIALALRSTATAVGPAAVLALGRQNGTGIVSDDDHIGDIRFASHDGTDLTHESARIRAAVDGAPGNNDVPGRLEFSTTADGAITPTERMRITSSGTVLIGGQTDYGVARTYLTQRTDDDGFGVVDANQTYTTLLYANAAGSVLKNNTNLPFSFQTSNTTAMTIDSSQRVLIGSTTARANLWNSIVAPQFQIESATDFGRQMAVISSSTNSGFGGVIIIAHQKSGTVGGNTISANGDTTGTLSFQGNDGTQFTSTASIDSQVDGTSGANDMPGRLLFKTVADGATSATERMRINNSGRVVIAGSSGNLNPPTTLMGDMNAYLRVGNSGAQIGSMVKYSYGPNTNVDGAVFQLRTGSNGSAAYIRITVSNYQGIFEAHYYCNNASGNWNVNQATVTDVGGANAPSLNYTSGVQNPTITVDLNNTSYSGGFLDVTASVAWQLTLA